MSRQFTPPVPPGKVFRIVIDTETTGLDWKVDEVVGYVTTFGPDPEDSFYWPVRHKGGGNFNPDEVEAWIKDILANRPHVINHHMKFDMHMMANHGLTINGNVECTMVNEALINENQHKFDLESSAKRRKVHAKKGEELYEHIAAILGCKPTKNDAMAHFHLMPGNDPFVVDYARSDGTATWQLWAAQQPIIEEQELDRVHAVECRVTNTLFRMERVGIAVDAERLSKFEQIIQEEKDKAERVLPKDFNVRSPLDVKSLMEHHGYTDWPMTDPSTKFPEGQPSFPESWLIQYPIGQKIVRVRKTRHLLESFLTPLRETHVYNGRVHTNFNQLKQEGAGTIARLSSSRPNMQQVPKRDKEFSPSFRACFVADPGYWWSSNDYMQQEYVVFSEYTQAPVLIEGYNSEPPVDIHSVIAELLSVMRDPTAKRMNMGMLNGMGRNLLAESIGCSVEEAGEYISKYNHMIPEVRRFNKAAEIRAKQRGWVKTKLGRRSRFPGKQFCHKAPSRIIQGTSADITKLKMAEVDEFFHEHGDRARLNLQIHDDLSWIFPDDDEGRWLDEEARKIMTNFGEGEPIEMKVKMRVDSGIAKDWGRASFPKLDEDKFL